MFKTFCYVTVCAFVTINDICRFLGKDLQSLKTVNGKESTKLTVKVQ